MAGQERNVIYYQGSGAPSDAENVMEIANNPYYTNIILSRLHMDETTGALSLGGTSIEDLPGPRDSAFGTIHLAYVRDPDGNKLCGIHIPG